MLAIGDGVCASLQWNIIAWEASCDVVLWYTVVYCGTCGIVWHGKLVVMWYCGIVVPLVQRYSMVPEASGSGDVVL